MQQDIMTVGLDLAKNVFQVHAIDGEGNVSPPAASARRGVEVLFRDVLVLGWYRGVRIGPSLGARVDRSWP
jgi:hypothetical protein